MKNKIFILIVLIAGLATQACGGKCGDFKKRAIEHTSQWIECDYNIDSLTITVINDEDEELVVSDVTPIDSDDPGCDGVEGTLEDGSQFTVRLSLQEDRGYEAELKTDRVFQSYTEIDGVNSANFYQNFSEVTTEGDSYVLIAQVIDTNTDEERNIELHLSNVEVITHQDESYECVYEW